ncbi:MAG: hypothetical protein ACREMB_21270 [Candidatus Rokuibacteriota bacterium]
MEHTRASIRDTVGELRDKASEATDWRHYVTRYPGTSLTVAVAAGMLVGRGLAAMLPRSNGEPAGEAYGYGAYSARGRESYGESALLPSSGGAAPEGRSAGEWLSGPRRVMGQSAARLGHRAESILNRIVDELADAVEQAVPAFTSRLTSFIDPARRGERDPGRRHAEHAGTGRLGQAGGDRF